MYVYCVYPAMSKSPKQLPNCLKRAEISIVLIVFNGVPYHVHPYTGTVPYFGSKWNMYQESYIGSVTVYSKNLSSQCNLSEKIEQAQDIIIDYNTIKPCVGVKGIYYFSFN